MEGERWREEGRHGGGLRGSREGGCEGRESEESSVCILASCERREEISSCWARTRASRPEARWLHQPSDIAPIQRDRSPARQREGEGEGEREAVGLRPSRVARVSSTSSSRLQGV
eukprot:scaffold237589_cov29-Tisochrysis_lutea.AAC.4